MSLYHVKFLAHKTKFTVITGFNTDINHKGVTYHVQTEDKGLKTPLILSLVYQGGTILASKRSPYEDLLEGTFDEKVLEDRLNRQHKLICAAIRAGRIEDLKRMTMKASSEKPEGLVVTKEVKKEKVQKPVEAKENVEIQEPPKEEESIKIPPVLPTPNKVEKTPVVQQVSEDLVPPVPKSISDLQIPKPSEEPVWDIPIIEDVEVVEVEPVEVAEIIEEEIILPPEAVEIIGDLEQFGSLLENELKVKILGENTFKSGDRKNINILVCRGTDDDAVKDANVMVKVIGSDFRPLIYHAKADNNGVATAFIKLPVFRSGRAAIMIRAMIDGEETELRRAISPE